MNPAMFLLLVQGIQAAIQAAPQVESAVVASKNYIAALVDGGVITTAQQSLVHTHVDAIVAAVGSGAEPPEFVVQPDPQ